MRFQRLKDRIDTFQLPFIALFFAATLLLPPCAISAENDSTGDDTYFFPAMEHFSRDDSDSVGTNESGNIYGIGVAARRRFGTSSVGSSNIEQSIEYDNKIMGNLALEVLAGRADFNAAPDISSTVNYRAFRTDADLGWTFNLGQGRSIEPFAGIRYQYKERDVDNSPNGSGFDDWRHQLSGRFGVRGAYQLNDSAALFGEAGLFMPGINKIKRNVPQQGSFVYSLGQDFSHFEKVGVRYASYRLFLYHEHEEVPGKTAGNLPIAPFKTDSFGAMIGFGY